MLITQVPTELRQLRTHRDAKKKKSEHRYTYTNVPIDLEKISPSSSQY